MNDFNPYAAPVTDLSIPHAPDEVGLWADGNLLVIRKGAELPDRCVNCNAPSGPWRLKRDLYWHRRIWYVLAVNPMVYLIAHFLVRKTARVRVPLCPHHHRRWRRLTIAAGWAVALPGVGLLLVVGRRTGGEHGHLLHAIAGVAILVGIVGGVLGSQVATPSRIDKRFVWVTKVHPAFLAELPRWAP